MRLLHLTLLLFAALPLLAPVAHADDRRFDRGYNQDQINQDRSVRERLIQERFSRNDRNSRNDRDYRNNDRNNDRNSRAYYREGYRDGIRAGQSGFGFSQPRTTTTTIIRPSAYDYSVYSGSNTVVHSYSSQYPYGFRQPLPGQYSGQYSGQSYSNYSGYQAYR